MNKIEGSSKLLSELETRLFQSEKEKVIRKEIFLIYENINFV